MMKKLTETLINQLALIRSENCRSSKVSINKIITNHHRQQHQKLYSYSMFHIKPSPSPFKVTLPLTIIFVLVSMLTLCIIRENQVNAGLIHIYHKYRPITPTTTTTNSAATTLDNLIANEPSNSTLSPTTTSSLEEALKASSNNEEQTAVEFTSPMKRIMELIGGHSPVIVVSSSTSSAASPSSSSTAASEDSSSPTSINDNSIQQQNHQQPTSDQAALAEFLRGNQLLAQQNQLHNSPASLINTNQQIASADRSHWSIIDPGQLIQANNQPILSTQQQQLIQSTVPYEQYYLTPNHHPLTSGDQQQFAVVPANIGFSPATNYPQQFAATFNPYQPYVVDTQHQQQQQQQQQQSQQVAPAIVQVPQLNKLEDKTQPIFLSSYVPEITTTTGSASTSPKLIGNTIAPQSVTERPNSIQQVQAQEKNEKQTDKQQEMNNDNDDNDESSKQKSFDSDEPDDSVINGGDIEEPSKIKRSHSSRPTADNNNNNNDDNSQHDDPPESGSMSYENKFDSDRDEQPKASFTSGSGSRKSFSSGRGNNNNNLVNNGLINVGLNDDCLQCICRATSGCDDTLRCITRGADEKYCGPFQLTEEYWNLSGSPRESSKDFESFEECANDLDCSIESVTGYMKKYHKDCDGDENITCLDYARLHKLKPTECGNTDKLTNNFDAYWEKFQRCAEMLNRTRDSEDENI